MGIENGMFEHPAGKIEKDRSRTIVLVSAIAVLAVIGLVFLVSSLKSKQAPLEFSRPGSPEFDGYATSVRLTNVEKIYGDRLNAHYGRFKLTLENAGDKYLTALQVRLAAINLNHEVKEKIITVIPNSRGPLAPNQTAHLDLSIDQIPERADLQDLTVEVYSLKTQ